MRMLQYLAVLVAAIFILTPVSQAQQQQDAAQVEKMAYLSGLDIYTFGFPLVYMELLRYQQSNFYKNDVTPYMSYGDWDHNTLLLDDGWQQGGAPNIDTLYSHAWVDVSKDPVILSHPDMGDRYFTFQLADYFSDNFDYAGMRATGSNAGHFAIVGPEWQGELPEGVTALKSSRTDIVYLAGRTLVAHDKVDQEKAIALMKQFRLTPLSQWQNREQYHASKKEWLKAPKPAAEALNPGSNPLAHWQSILDSLARFPTPKEHKVMINFMKNIGLKPGINVEKDLDEATKKGLARAAIDGFQKLRYSSTRLGDRVGGSWISTATVYGESGVHGQYLLRAAQQSLSGIVAHNQEEAVYTYVTRDKHGHFLEGNNAYKVHFNKGQLPPAKAFWSITNYNMKLNFITNDWKKYTLGDRNKDLVYDENGGLTIYFSKEPPADKSLMPNWLATPKSGNFIPVIRTYIPEKSVLDRTWELPAVEPVVQ